MEKFIPYEKLSKKGSDPTATSGGYREGSEWQRSARSEPASSGEGSAGHRNRGAKRLKSATCLQVATTQPHGRQKNPPDRMTRGMIL